MYLPYPVVNVGLALPAKRIGHSSKRPADISSPVLVGNASYNPDGAFAPFETFQLATDDTKR